MSGASRTPDHEVGSRVLDLAAELQKEGFTDGQIIIGIERALGAVFGAMMIQGTPRAWVHDQIEAAQTVIVTQADAIVAFNKLNAEKQNGK